MHALHSGRRASVKREDGEAAFTAEGSRGRKNEGGHTESKSAFKSA